MSLSRAASVGGTLGHLAKRCTLNPEKNRVAMAGLAQGRACGQAAAHRRDHIFGAVLARVAGLRAGAADVDDERGDLVCAEAGACARVSSAISRRCVVAMLHLRNFGTLRRALPAFPGKSFALNVLAGGVSALSVDFPVYPLDFVRAQLRLDLRRDRVRQRHLLLQFLLLGALLLQPAHLLRRVADRLLRRAHELVVQRREVLELLLVVVVVPHFQTRAQ